MSYEAIKKGTETAERSRDVIAVKHTQAILAHNSAFRCARDLIKAGDAKGARKKLLECGNLLNNIRARTDVILEHAVLELDIRAIIDICVILREQGITDDVRIAFGLMERKPIEISKEASGHEDPYRVESNDPFDIKKSLPSAKKQAPKPSSKKSSNSAKGNDTEKPENKAPNNDYLFKDPDFFDSGDKEAKPKSSKKATAKPPVIKKPDTDNSDLQPSDKKAASEQPGGLSPDWCADIFNMYENSIVEIQASNGGLYAAAGTGFIISENGYLLTNDHVVFDDERRHDYYEMIHMQVGPDQKIVSLQLIASDKKNDVALCRFDMKHAPKGIRAIPRIKDYKELKPGAKIVLIGNPLGMGLAPVEGNVRYPKNKEGNLVYTAISNHGDSGGPVFNTKGECVGINKSKIVASGMGSQMVEVEGMTNATPMSKIDELLKKWCSQHNIEL